MNYYDYWENIDNTQTGHRQPCHSQDVTAIGKAPHSKNWTQTQDFAQQLDSPIKQLSTPIIFLFARHELRKLIPASETLTPANTLLPDNKVDDDYTFAKVMRDNPCPWRQRDSIIHLTAAMAPDSSTHQQCFYQRCQ